MHDGKLMELIDQAVELDRLVQEKQAELKDLKSRIAGEADSRDAEQLPTDGGGWSWTMQGNNGCICRVTRPAPTLKADIDGEGKTIEKVRAAAGKHFTRLFQQAPKWKPVPGFREEAQSLLGRSAAAFIKLCSSQSAPRVAFETKPDEAQP